MTFLEYRAVLDALPVLVALVRSNGEFIAANSLFKNLADESGCGAHPEQLIPAEVLVHLLQGSANGKIRHSFGTEAGTRKWIDWSSSPWPGAPDMVLLTGIDVTGEAGLHEHLIGNQWFETAAALSGGLAHEFNNALAAVLGLSEIISLRLPGDSPLQEFTGRIATSIERAKGIVRRFSQFSRRATGVIEAQPTAMILEELVPVLKAYMPPGVSVTSAISPEIEWCSADRHALEQIVFNCATYFRTHLRNKGGKVKLVTAPPHEPGWIAIEMTGTAACLGDASAESIFDLDLSPATTAYESGCGLFVAKTLAERGGGRLSARAEAPHSVTFTLALPVAP